MKRDSLLAFELKSLNNQIRRLLDPGVLVDNDAKLTGMQLGLLGYINDKREYGDVYQRDIEEEFNIRRSTASSMIKQMEAAGYVRRESDPADARLKKIILTEKALELNKVIEQNMLQLQERLMQGISQEEIQQFYKTLHKIQKNAKG